MKSKRIALGIPIMIIVFLVAVWMLNDGYPEIGLGIRVIIAFGAALLSGGISYFLFPEAEDKK